METQTTESRMPQNSEGQDSLQNGQVISNMESLGLEIPHIEIVLSNRIPMIMPQDRESSKNVI